MLSPAKISVRNDRKGEYYLKLSHEDYYVTPGEPLGVWYGRGAAKLGLQGTVDQFAFVSLLLDAALGTPPRQLVMGLDEVDRGADRVLQALLELPLAGRVHLRPQHAHALGR